MASLLWLFQHDDVMFWNGPVSLRCVPFRVPLCPMIVVLVTIVPFAERADTATNPRLC